MMIKGGGKWIFGLVELDGAYDYDSFIENQLNNNDHIWRVCSWAREYGVHASRR